MRRLNMTEGTPGKPFSLPGKQRLRVPLWVGKEETAQKEKIKDARSRSQKIIKAGPTQGVRK